MKSLKISRRSFLKTNTAALAGAMIGNPFIMSGGGYEPLKISKPFHGAILNRRHGEEVTGGLKYRVHGRAPLKDIVTVNNIPAQREGSNFFADIVISNKETEIIAVSKGIYGNNEHSVRVVWDRYSQPRYRFSIDDNIFFLRDIAQKKYKSLFECHSLNILRELHTRYGTRFVLNLYWESEDGFNLTRFPDRYKGEWRDNSDWLRLAFHANAQSPERPYQYASASKLIGDLDKVSGQIIRFAGEETCSIPTVIHYAEVHPTALKPLADRGVQVLSGYFKKDSRGDWQASYTMDDEIRDYISRHDALMDFDSGIIFSKVDLVCNEISSIDTILPALNSLSKDPDTAEIMDLFTHEQGFWSFHKRYIPDHEQRLEMAIRWVTENGYKPVFFDEGFLGGQDY